MRNLSVRSQAVKRDITCVIVERPVAATFERRKTTIPETLPDAFIPAFASDENKLLQWSTFIRDLYTENPPLDIVISEPAAFVGPIVAEARVLLQRRATSSRGGD